MMHPRFAAVGALFAQRLASDRELGARFCVIHRGELVVDLYGGYADKARTQAFDDRTLAPVFSVTKLIAAVLIARLVDENRIAYDQPVAEVWPAFAACGKASVTIGQMMSHQAGLSGFPTPMAPEDWYDWSGVCERLAAMAPLWPPGEASGYHPVTFGYLAGEVFRRTDGRTMGRALADDIAGPFDLDLFIGLPASEDGRVCELERPRQLPKFGPPTPALKAAFLTRWASPGGRGSQVWRRAEIPSANGHATALGLARLVRRVMDPDGGLLSGRGFSALTQRRIRGRDLVLPFDLAWGAGVMLNEGVHIYGPEPTAFGHSGWGGACAAGDARHDLALAYVMNRQSADLIGDPRAVELIEATYACL